MNILYAKKPLPVALALGSNSGDAGTIFDRACDLLQQNGFSVEKRAPVIKTAPVDCPEGTPDFSNSALTGYWIGSAEELLKLTQSIEETLGRPADHIYHDVRTCDIDIIIFGDQITDTPELTIPHPRAQERDFVLQPLSQIAPEWIFPDSRITVGSAREKLLAAQN